MRDKASAFKAVMAEYRVCPTETIAIGDALGDCEAAVAAGPMLGFIAARYYVDSFAYELQEYQEIVQNRLAGAPYAFWAPKRHQKFQSSWRNVSTAISSLR